LGPNSLRIAEPLNYTINSRKLSFQGSPSLLGVVQCGDEGVEPRTLLNCVDQPGFLAPYSAQRLFAGSSSFIGFVYPDFTQELVCRSVARRWIDAGERNKVVMSILTVSALMGAPFTVPSLFPTE
jgi:hypothetical protein